MKIALTLSLLLSGCYASHAAPPLALCPDEVQAYNDKARELGCAQAPASLSECPALCTTIDGAPVHLDDSIRRYVTSCEELEGAILPLCP